MHFDRDVGISLKSVLEYYQQLRVLMHAWAWAGNYFVKYNQDQILMMDLTTSLSYADRCLKDVLEFGGGSLRWLERNDVLTRAHKWAGGGSEGNPHRMAQPCDFCWI